MRMKFDLWNGPYREVNTKDELEKTLEEEKHPVLEILM